MSKNLPDSQKDKPRFRNKDTRIRIALAKYHGMDGEEWAISEIAEYLNVSDSKVEDYLFNSEMSDEMEGMLAEAEAQTRLELLADMKQKLETLQQIEKQVAQETEAVPTSYTLETMKAEVSSNELPNVKDIDNEEKRVDVQVPVPERFAEIPNVEELTDVWREQRLVREQIEDLLGLEAPDEIEASSERTIDIKHWEMSGVDDDGLPEQDVIEVESNEVESDASLPEQREVPDDEDSQ